MEWLRCVNHNPTSAQKLPVIVLGCYLCLARMEVDCNLKKWANFFKFFLCILEKSLKIYYGSFFLGEKPLLIFTSRSCKSNN